jgi:tRNA-binding EMAP/Myf-like protein
MVGALQGKKGKKEKGGAAAPVAAPAGAAKAAEGEPTVDALDLRVGQITNVRLHPNAESLYLEDIDLGEAQPRQVGLLGP